MAQKIIWSPDARKDRKAILKYWIERNKSTTYSIRLNKLISESILLIATYPKIGIKTDFENVFSKQVRDYSILYQKLDKEIHVLRIWDNRQNPKRLKVK